MIKRLAAVFLSVLILGTGLASTAQAGGDPAFIRFGGGYYDINDDQDAGEFHLEYITDLDWWIFTPMVGVMATTDAAAYVYAGIRADIYLGRRWVITPQFAPGLYHDGDGKDLGHVIEFRSGLEVAYRFDDRSRLGLTLYHLSNASLDDNNPGTEVVTLHYSLPMTSLFND
ncbi:acyloxyacyl hydrolase [Hwanghaeella grinnelliae]|uniref:Acyloxyacyl hydrolase n=1 Tax=Hwanghaeella grinnelliae TaxID=2500179 RepID=A0A437QL36_9PROT|nr:acyloxyacyl hydrolase [Hwanghaeella grinnelliae]RVU35221.1 acyloxyacyl hydrolase [Hwanghaeella grinnelliae]